ncbi:MAG: hypothetical protein Q8R15_03450 [Candidatus Micrarchaeota archaeon]|nr:hypothetical protein [Candidatus Micrarchaeota archaeon]
MKFDSIKKTEFQANAECVDCTNLSISDEKLQQLIGESITKAMQE